MRSTIGAGAQQDAVTQISSIDLHLNSDPARIERSRDDRVRASALIHACRPLQWTKNALLVAAPTAAGLITVPAIAIRVAGAIAAFCMLSSATYLLNDVRDRDQDRRHPRKRLRPIAAGLVPVRAALILAVVLAVGGLALAAVIRPELALVGCGYLALTASYSLWLRRVIVVDIAAIAAGFVLRAAAGGVAAGVPLSRWFLVVTTCGAVFVVAGKRHAELFGRARDAGTRATLRRYSERALRVLLVFAATGMLAGYAIWAFRRPEIGPWYEVGASRSSCGSPATGRSCYGARARPPRS